MVGLLTAGRSNREIAPALVLSERTVESHVQNVLDEARFQLPHAGRHMGRGERGGRTSVVTEERSVPVTRTSPDVTGTPVFVRSAHEQRPCVKCAHNPADQVRKRGREAPDGRRGGGTGGRLRVGRFACCGGGRRRAATPAAPTTTAHACAPRWGSTVGCNPPPRPSTGFSKGSRPGRLQSATAAEHRVLERAALRQRGCR